MYCIVLYRTYIPTYVSMYPLFSVCLALDGLGFESLDFWFGVGIEGRCEGVSE